MKIAIAIVKYRLQFVYLRKETLPSGYELVASNCTPLIHPVNHVNLIK